MKHLTNAFTTGCLQWASTKINVHALEREREGLCVFGLTKDEG